MKRNLAIPSGLFAGLLLVAALMFTATPATARVNVDLNIGIPAPVYYVPPQPVYYVQPRPVYVQPHPVYVHPRPYYIQRHHHKHHRQHHRHKHRSHGSHRH